MVWVKISSIAMAAALLSLSACSDQSSDPASQTTTTTYTRNSPAAERIALETIVGETNPFALASLIISDVNIVIDGCASGFTYTGVASSASLLYKGDTNCRLKVNSLLANGTLFTAPAAYDYTAGATNLFATSSSNRWLSLVTNEMLDSPLSTAARVSFVAKAADQGTGFSFSVGSISISSSAAAIFESGSAATITLTRTKSSDLLVVSLLSAGDGLGRVSSIPAQLSFPIGVSSLSFDVSGLQNSTAEEDDSLTIEIAEGGYLLPDASVGLTIMDRAPTQTMSSSFIGAGPITLDFVVSSEAVATDWLKISGPGNLSVVYADDKPVVSVDTEGTYIIEAASAGVNGQISRIQSSLTYDLQAPAIAEVNLLNGAADGTLNAADIAEALPVVQAPPVTDISTFALAYAIVLNSAQCDGSASYSASIPLSDDSGFLSGQSYFICVRAIDSWNRIAYRASSPFALQTTYPIAVISGQPTGTSGLTALSVSVTATGGLAGYRYKIGIAGVTDCTSSTSYSDVLNSTIPITDNVSSFSSQTVKLCVVAGNSAGNWQPYSLATTASWSIDTVAPQSPAGFTATKLPERIALRFTPNATDTSGYLVLRYPDSSPSGSPVNGATYTVGSSLGNGTVVYNGPAATVFVSLLGDTLNRFYSVHAYDTVFNYSVPAFVQQAADSKTAFNAANGIDRTVRGLLPMNDGSGRVYVFGEMLVHGSTTVNRIVRHRADGSLDPSFIPPAVNGTIFAAVEDNQGRLYIGGSFTKVGSTTATRLARLGSSGTLDSSFPTVTGPNNTVQAMDLDETLGRLYIGGAFTAVGSTTANRITALATSNGVIDSSFATGTGLDNTVFALVVDKNLGGVYLGGSFTRYRSAAVTTNTNRLTKLNTNGTLSSSFLTGTGAGNTVYALALDSFNNLYVGGAMSSYQSNSAYRFLFRVNPSGAIDTSFSVSKKPNATVWALTLDEVNSRMYIGGDFTLYGTTSASRFARLALDTTGTLDTAFTSLAGSAGANSTVFGIKATSSALWIGGNFNLVGTNNAPYVARISLTNGSLGSTPLGSMFNTAVLALAQGNSSDEMYIAGNFNFYKGAAVGRLIRSNKSGLRDSSYAPNVAGQVNSMFFDASTNRLVVAGAFTTINGSTAKRIARLTSTGALDTTFSASTAFDSDVYTVARDPSGAIWAGGKFTVWNTTACKYLCKLNANGTMDTSLSQGTGLSNLGYINAIAPTGDGGAIVGGTFTSYNGVRLNRIFKIQANGSVDYSFTIGTGFNNTVRVIRIIGGKVYVGGDFTNYNGTAVNRIVRLNMDGTRDASFAIGSGANNLVYEIQFDAHNDRIVIGGSFTSFNSVSSTRVAALLTTGARDTSFVNSTFGYNSTVQVLLPTYDGLYAGGAFSAYNTVVNGYISRLHWTGSQL